MNRCIWFLLCLTLIFALPAEGRRKSKIIRGGQGFLFLDHNDLSNPGQLSRSKGAAIEVLYGTQSQASGTQQTVTPSLAYGSGRIGFGVSATRVGTSLDSEQSTDVVGGGLGFSLGKRRNVNLGFTYVRSIEDNTSDNGTVGGVINFNPNKGEGIVFGLGGSTVIGGSGTAPVTATAGLGYTGKNRNNNIEVNFTFDDVNDTSRYRVGGFFTLGSKSYYFGAGYLYKQLASGTESNLLGRLGLVLGKGGVIDLSGFIDYRLEGGTDPLFGGTLRVNF